MSMGLDRKPQVRRTTPPSESVVASWYENASLLDSYSIDLSASEQSSMRELATRTLVNPPAWPKGVDRAARRHGYALWHQNLRYGQDVPGQP